jgi:Rieske Fe-S protein
MKPGDGTVIPVGRLSRRDFCKMAGVTAIGVGLVACAPGGSDGQGLVQTGPISDPGQNPNPDMMSHDPDAGAQQTQRDSGTQQRDSGTQQRDSGVSQQADSGVVQQPDSGTVVGANCPTSVKNVGQSATFTMGSATYFSSGNFFVVRDGGGLYALSAVCTHAGCTVQKKTSNFYCPCHRATFSLTGDAVSGPVFQGLDHYSMCSLGGGMVGVDTRTRAGTSDRLNM